MLKFEDPDNGPRRLLREDEQDLGEVLRIELDRLVSLLHPADAITEERARAQIQGTRARSSVDKWIRDLERRDDNLASAFSHWRRASRSWRVVAMSRFRFA
jgi:hypothetical protein